MPVFTCASVRRKVGGHTFELRMNFDALSMAEKITGRNLLDNEAWGNLDISSLTVIFWTACQQFDKKLTLADVRAAGGKAATEMLEACNAAWRVAHDLPEERPRPMSGSEPQTAGASAQ